MTEYVEAPAVIAAQGAVPKLIEEFVSVCVPAFSPETAHRDEG